MKTIFPYQVFQRALLHATRGNIIGSVTLGKWFGIIFKVEDAHASQSSNSVPKEMSRRNSDLCVHRDSYSTQIASSGRMSPGVILLSWEKEGPADASTTRTNLIDLMLREESRFQKKAYDVIPFTWN